MAEDILAVRCVRRECARMTIFGSEQQRPTFCGFCGAQVEDVQLRKAKPQWWGR